MATMINPTRMNLINLKKRTVIARKGHSILKRKREVLVIEFLKLLKESKESRSALNEIIKNSYRTVAIATTVQQTLFLGFCICCLFCLLDTSCMSHL